MGTEQRLAEVTFLDKNKRGHSRYNACSSGQSGYRPYDKLNRQFLPCLPPVEPRLPEQTRAEWQRATKANAWKYLKTTTVADHKLREVESVLDRRAA